MSRLEMMHQLAMILARRLAVADRGCLREREIFEELGKRRVGFEVMRWEKIENLAELCQLGLRFYRGSEKNQTFVLVAGGIALPSAKNTSTEIVYFDPLICNY